MPAGQTPRAHPLWRLTQLRLREIAREPGTLFWIFGFPVLLTVALGLAFRGAAAPAPAVAVVAAAPEAWAQALAGAGFQVQRLPRGQAEARLRAGQVSLLIAPAGGGVDYRFDPTRPESRLARLAADQALQRAWGRRDPVAARDDPVTQPGARYVDFLVPGLIGMNVMSGSMWAVAFGLANLRVRRLLKRLLATPMRRRHLLASMVLARVVVLPFEIGALLIFAWLAFDVHVRGSLVAVGAVAVAGSLCFGGLALLIASRAQNVETVTGLMNSVMLPMFVLSGVFFSPARFPHWMQPLLSGLPLSALNQALRAVIVDGAALSALGAPAAVLLAWGAGGYALGLRFFRWS
jgi:ABC-type multidrug transport system permease subunit